MDKNDIIKEIQKNADKPDVDKHELIETITFYIDGQLFGFGLSFLNEIVEYKGHSVVPFSPDYILGLVNLRGEVIPLISLRVLLGFEEKIQRKSKIIVVEKDLKVGLLIDDINDIYKFDITEFKPELSTLDKEKLFFISNEVCIKSEDNEEEDIITIIDLDKLLSSDLIN